MHGGRLSNYRDEKVKASVHLAFQQNKQLEIQTLVIVISAVVVSERSSFHGITRLNICSPPRSPEHSTL